jgi:hypothetical protein
LRSACTGMFVISALTKPTSSPTATTPSTRPWNVGRAGLWLFTKLAGSPLEVPTSMPKPDTENVTTSEAVGTTAPLASTTATWVTRTRHQKSACALQHGGLCCTDIIRLLLLPPQQHLDVGDVLTACHKALPHAVFHRYGQRCRGACGITPLLRHHGAVGVRNSKDTPLLPGDCAPRLSATGTHTHTHTHTHTQYRTGY